MLNAVDVAANASQEEDGATRLRQFASTQIPRGGLVVVANREPYVERRDGEGNVSVERAPGGLVTAIEPMLRACGGTWIAHSSGGNVANPREYQLRRLRIDPETYDRYYSGFANEALWPLCHMAHTQPLFRVSDWEAYQSVNEAFALAACNEARDDAFVLVQDYHFALVPRMLRKQSAHLVSSLFWHIPWPHPEIFAISPWKQEILEGMMGADIVGFHTSEYCLNFLESARRYARCRVDFHEMTIEGSGHRTHVQPYPISVEWPYPSVSRFAGDELRESLGIAHGVHVSVGIDRADYTKGLLERVAAVETLLEQNRDLIGKYVLVQLAAPTRGSIPRYRELSERLSQAVARVNERFGTATWKPIHLQMRNFTPDEVRTYYAMANSALVTPLHDGMNLVAKEYVAACHDGDGALVLSTFAGAAKELDGALLVNPYDTQQVANAITCAVNMPFAERRGRMQSMRKRIASHSIYDWSENLLRDMKNVRMRGGRFWSQRAPARELRAP